MREIRLSSLEGGGAETRSPYPYQMVHAVTRAFLPASRWMHRVQARTGVSALRMERGQYHDATRSSDTSC